MTIFYLETQCKVQLSVPSFCTADDVNKNRTTCVHRAPHLRHRRPRFSRARPPPACLWGTFRMDCTHAPTAGKFLWSSVAPWWGAMSAPPHMARRATSPRQRRALTNEPMTQYPVPSCHLPLALSETGTLFWSHQSMILTFGWMLDHFHPEIDVHFLL